MDKSVGQNTQTCGDAIGQILRVIYPLGTAKLISRDVHVPVRTVERWIEGTSAPSLDHFARLVAAHPSILMVLLPSAPWLEAALLWLEQSRLDAGLAAMPAKRQRAIDALRGRR